MLDPELAAAIGRVKGAKTHGRRTGNRLTAVQAERMLLPDRASNRGKRHRALLTLEHIGQRDARWAIVDLVRKDKRVCSVAMPHWAKVAIYQCVAAAGITGDRLLRGVNNGDPRHGRGHDRAIDL